MSGNIIRPTLHPVVGEDHESDADAEEESITAEELKFTRMPNAE